MDGAAARPNRSDSQAIFAEEASDKRSVGLGDADLRQAEREGLLLWRCEGVDTVEVVGVRTLRFGADVPQPRRGKAILAILRARKSALKNLP
jgi:hypothetical protein